MRYNKTALLFVSALLSVGYSHALDKSQGLPVPAIPDSLQSREQKVAFAASHFWDAMDFGDAELAEDEAFIEQSMVNYLFFLDFLQTNSIDSAEPSVKTLLERSKENAKSHKLICNLTSKYLYDSDSPMRNEDVYDIFIDAQLSDTTLSQIDRIRLEEQRSLMNLNRPGQLLNDFSFMLGDGSQHSYMAYRNPESHSLLIFYDPDCDECIETIRELSCNPELAQQVASSVWQVFAIARYGTEDSWRQQLPQMPEQWVNGYDCDDVEGLGTYDLPAAPTVLSVNPDGTVAEKYGKAIKQWMQ